MRAVALSPAGVLETVDKPEPEPGPDEVVVDVERCGICGSDLHFRFSGLLPAGAVMGHEFAGTVVAAGDAAGIPTGTRVAVLPSRRDGTCEQCRQGKTHLCRAQATTSIGLGLVDGGYAEYAKAPAQSCHLLPPQMTAEQGATVEPYAVALHAVRRSRAAQDPSLNVGVIGAGPIGLLTVAALQHEGATNITVAERSETRAQAAEALGARVTDDADRLAAAAGEELDVVFDCAGVPATTPAALLNAKPGGQIVLVGVVDVGVPIPMPGLLWVVKEVDVLPSIAYTDEEFAEAVEHISAAGIAIPTEVRPLDAAEQSFDDLRQPGGPIKVQLAP
jgi:(R,R)-butanediol dehydrogenase/meso-butanediol dehydrogenase/diacetyl reductase